MLPIMYEMNKEPIEKRFWVQCENCKLYLDTNEQCFLSILHNYPGPSPGSTHWICKSCLEKNSLIVELTNMHETVKYLNNTIRTLNRRIDSLQDINTKERELDNTIDELAAQLSSWHVSDTLCDNNSGNTATCANSSDNTNTIPAVAAIVDVVCDKSHATLSTINNTSVWTGLDSTSTNVNQTVSNANSMIETRTLNDTAKTKSALDRPIKTLFVGDSALRNVKLLGGLGNTQSCLRIAKQNASLADLVDTIEYFTNEVYKDSISTVILQTCTKDIKHGLTESIIQLFEYLMRKMTDRGISMIIVGPLPLPNFSSIAFSRACCINDWLENNIAESENVEFVNIFDFFWNNDNQFSRNMYLNSVGQLNLAKCITEKCSLLTKSCTGDT